MPQRDQVGAAQSAVRLLVVSAFEPELRVLRTKPVDHVEFAEVGIGLVEAALGIAALLQRHRPQGLVFVGTAGQVEAGPIGALCVSTRVSLVPHAGELPAPMPRTVDSESQWIADAVDAGFSRATVATTLGISTTDADAAAVSGYQLEHLEAFAVARAAARAELPFVALLAVANSVGTRGRAEWLQHHERVSADLAQHAHPLLCRWATRA